MKQWFALLVQPRKEKVVEKELLKNGFENYLPCKKELHQWSDRRKLVSVVVIPSYIFVRIDPKEMYNVLILPHTVRFIFFEKTSTYSRCSNTIFKNPFGKSRRSFCSRQKFCCRR